MVCTKKARASQVVVNQSILSIYFIHSFSFQSSFLRFLFFSAPIAVPLQSEAGEEGINELLNRHPPSPNLDGIFILALLDKDQRRKLSKVFK